MINVSGNHITDLYTRNIIGEHFPEYCFSLDKSIECNYSLTMTPDYIIANMSINGEKVQAKEILSNHLNDRLATTTAIGKAVISYAKSKSRQIAHYGVLTGVRPFKIAIDLISRFEYDEVINKLKNTYLVSNDKIELLLSAAMYDNKIRSQHRRNDVSVYISIPFCPTRCNYCSFISSAAPSKMELTESYVCDVKEEITAVSELINKHSLNLKSIYIGGGTPTTLDNDQLNDLLSHIDSRLPVQDIIEYTVEAGRPDTIDCNKLDTMKKFGVTRTCVNCQSTDDNVLNAIGRGHNAETFFKAFETVKEYNFDTVNTDIIAGFDCDTFESFKKTVDDVLSLSPESITVHTLCIKKSAEMKLLERLGLEKNIDEYIEYSKSACILEGYLPYYLYKQKYSVGNHENVGYCLHSHESYYNIAMMNEIEHIIGIGAGATSRLIDCNDMGKIEHFANYKYPTEYIGGYEKIKANIDAMDKALTR